MNDHNELSGGIDHGKTGRPPMQPRAKITREAILEASAILFSKTGYAGTTIDDIVTLAPVTKGAMYFHFSKKESIAREMLRRWSDAVTTTVGKAILVSTRQRITTGEMMRDRGGMDGQQGARVHCGSREHDLGDVASR